MRMLGRVLLRATYRRETRSKQAAMESAPTLNALPTWQNRRPPRPTSGSAALGYDIDSVQTKVRPFGFDPRRWNAHSCMLHARLISLFNSDFSEPPTARCCDLLTRLPINVHILVSGIYTRPLCVLDLPPILLSPITTNTDASRSWCGRSRP